MLFAQLSNDYWIELSEKESVFVLQRHWFKKPVETKLGALREYFDLYFRMPNGKVDHFLLSGDPRKGTVKSTFPASGKLVDPNGKTLDPFDVNGTIPLQTTDKEIAPHLSTVARGVATLSEDGKTYTFSSKPFSGAFDFEKRAPSLWRVTRATKLEKHDRTIQVFKSDPMQQIVWGVVLEPNEVDSQGHFITAPEIAEALHYFMLNWQLMDEEHARVVPRSQASPVEAFQAPMDMDWPLPNGTYKIKAGSWVMATKIFDKDLWKKYLAGELNAYSIRGWGKIRDAGAKEGEHATD